jgi:arginyl-tRNA synthetase
VGESTYQRFLPGLVDELLAAGIAEVSDGAVCVFTDGITGPDGAPIPLIVRKSDGGFGYAATDLAALRYRIRELRTDRVLYVVDARQALHFRMVFETARRAGWLPAGVRVEHVRFGTVLGADGKPFRTRHGGTAALGGLLDAAVAGARRVLDEREHDLTPAELESVALAAGIGAVKYADLSTSRTRDYVFDLERMVALAGNTAVYLQYAHARVGSILHRVPGGGQPQLVDVTLPTHPAERGLALALDDYGAVLVEVADSLEPHRLCTYLYTLAKAFSDFTEACPVLRAETVARQRNRLASAS